MSSAQKWKFRGGGLEIGSKSGIVGILNVTPDSFSDGGDYSNPETAARRAEAMLEEGAVMVDVGGESTRPNYAPVSVGEEIGRVVPVVEAIVSLRKECIVSIDTSKSAVAAAAIDAGAKVVNDVSGFELDKDMAALCAEREVGVVLMRNGRLDQGAGEILDRVRRYWERSLSKAKAAGVDEGAIALDPGIGFGTTRSEDLEMLRQLEVLRAFGFPMMLGTSRKRITAEPNGLPLDARLSATLATTVAGVAAGIEFFRVHDVLENVRAAAFADLLYRGGKVDE